MFPSSTSCSHNRSMDTNGNPSSSTHDQEINMNPSPSILDFPAPFLDNDHEQYHSLLSDWSHLLSQQQQQQIQGSKSTELVMDGQGVEANVSTRSGNKKSSGRRRSGKKDRHSKIYTAQGPRDRRMRLSLPIARKFFDLQDMLGFDKASKTIEWLFSKSKAAIKDLTTRATVVGGGRIVSSTSESEVMSIAKICSATTHDWDHDKEEQVGDAESSGNVGGEEEEDEKKMKSKKAVKKGMVQLLQTRSESRDKARARARERTMEKLMKTKKDWGSCSSQELMNEAPSHHDELLAHQMAASANIMEKHLSTAIYSSSNLNCSITDNVGISRSVGNKSKDFVIPANWDIYNDSYYPALTNTETSPGNAGHLHQVQNPSAVFVTNSNGQQQWRISTLEQNPSLNSGEQNPNSALYPSFLEQNPAGYYPGIGSSEIVFRYDNQFLQQENHHFSGKF